MAQPRIVTTETEPAQIIALRISAKQRRALQRVAKRQQVSVSQVLRDLIDEGIGA
jgi:DNA-binding phage protein